MHRCANLIEIYSKNSCNFNWSKSKFHVVNSGELYTSGWYVFFCSDLHLQNKEERKKKGTKWKLYIIFSSLQIIYWNLLVYHIKIQMKQWFFKLGKHYLILNIWWSKCHIIRLCFRMDFKMKEYSFLLTTLRDVAFKMNIQLYFQTYITF